jgi:hypothetical protein
MGWTVRRFRMPITAQIRKQEDGEWILFKVKPRLDIC